MIVLDMQYKDDVFDGKRKYTQETNEDGTISFTDATQYSQVGNTFGGIDMNKINAAIMGFSSCTTNFVDSKHIIETDAYGKKKKTTFNDDGTIYEALYEADDTFICGKTTTISSDGKTIQEVADL